MNNTEKLFSIVLGGLLVAALASIIYREVKARGEQ